MSLTWAFSKPSNPNVGDCYVDRNDNQTFIWQGTAWATFSAKAVGGIPFIAPSEEQLEKHPALKQAWEEFLVVKKLLGV